MSGRRVALVTGGRRGIGLGIARCLAADGFDIAICGISPEADSQDARAALSAHSVEVLYVQADVSVAADRSALLGRRQGPFRPPRRAGE